MQQAIATVSARKLFENAAKPGFPGNRPQGRPGQNNAQCRINMSFKQQQAAHRLAGCLLPKIIQRRLVSSGRSAT